MGLLRCRFQLWRVVSLLGTNSHVRDCSGRIHPNGNPAPGTVLFPIGRRVTQGVVIADVVGNSSA